jgi:hypothetical protein
VEITAAFAVPICHARLEPCDRLNGELAQLFLALFAEGPARWLGLGAWLVMALTFQPMLRYYRQSPLWDLALPAIGAAYAFFTVQSAVDFWRGRGDLWKAASRPCGRRVSSAIDFASGKGHRDENFPGGLAPVRAELRPTILQLSLRAADDIADHTTANAGQKLAEPDRLEAGRAARPRPRQATRYTACRPAGSQTGMRSTAGSLPAT